MHKLFSYTLILSFSGIRSQTNRCHNNSQTVVIMVMLSDIKALDTFRFILVACEVVSLQPFAGLIRIASVTVE